MDLIDRVYEILKPLNLPCNYLVRPSLEGNVTVLSYHFFNQGYGLYGRGKGKFMGGSLQVDIFTLGNSKETENKIIKLMEKEKFKFTYPTDDEEVYKNTPLYRRSLIFTYIESEVLKV